MTLNDGLQDTLRNGGPSERRPFAIADPNLGNLAHRHTYRRQRSYNPFYAML